MPSRSKVTTAQLAAGIAHDLNNLLTVINGFSASYLQDLDPSNPMRPGLEQILAAGAKAAELTRFLLNLGQGKTRQPLVIDLHRLLDGARPMLQRMLGDDIELRLEFGAAVPYVLGDPHRLEQALMNLAGNARDAMPRGGTFVIETDDEDACILLAVSDDGCGMSEEVRQRVFEPFFTTKAPDHGTGLGLAEVQQVIEDMGGDIDVETAEAAGTTFLMRLPRCAELPLDVPVSERAVVPGGTETVLVVEDRHDVLELVSLMLSGYGYDVVQAPNADAALAVDAPIQLLLTDIHLPGMSGCELAERMLTRMPELKVLYMSGSPDAMANPAVEFLTKPFTPQDLAARIRRVLNS